MEPSDILATAGGTAGVGVMVKYAWDYLRNRNEQLETKVEGDRDEKLDKVLTVVQRMERDLAVMSTEAKQQAVALGNVYERVEGISKNHGGRLGELEQRLAVLDESVKELKTRRRR